jgi:Uma2 family endonuclease
VSPEHLLLVIEILSPTTWRQDLGVGDADDVDRPRTYLESGVPEYWVSVTVENRVVPPV